MASIPMRCPYCSCSFQVERETMTSALCVSCGRAMRWYYARDQQRFGPMLFGQLYQLARKGELRAYDMVYQEGHGQWLPAQQIPGLFSDTLLSEGTVTFDHPPRPAAPTASASRPPPLRAEHFSNRPGSSAASHSSGSRFLSECAAIASATAVLTGRGILFLFRRGHASRPTLDSATIVRAVIGYFVVLLSLCPIILLAFLVNAGANQDTDSHQTEKVASKNGMPENVGQAAGVNNQIAGDNKLTGKQIYDRTLLSTVWIRTQQGHGSGCLIDREQQLVVTNAHVVPYNQTAYVYFPRFQDGKVVAERAHYLQMFNEPEGPIAADVVWRDSGRDLALLQLQRVPESAPVIKLAEEGPGPGETVHAVGNRGASDALWVYTSGTVSQNYFKRWTAFGGAVALHLSAWVIETQVPTNPGDSGGPVVNSRGELVGITQGYNAAGQGISYAIEIREIRTILAQYHKVNLAPG